MRAGRAVARTIRSSVSIRSTSRLSPAKKKVSPGRKVADRIAGGRRIAHFVSDAPILAFFSIQSARYAEKARMADGVRLSVHYDPAHGFNVARMLTAMQAALGYYRANFGPYQFDYARIIEYPGYSSYAQAFAGTIPYSERIGFIADARVADDIDYVTYVTAHELAHHVHADIWIAIVVDISVLALGFFAADRLLLAAGPSLGLGKSNLAALPVVLLAVGVVSTALAPLGHALSRPSQLDMRTTEPSGGIFAPTLRYHEKRKRFYMTTSVVHNLAWGRVRVLG